MKWFICMAMLSVLVVAGCANPSGKTAALKLGMNPEAVVGEMGEPSSIRAAKLYSNDEWTEVWQYDSPVLSIDPQTVWVYFENGKVVQWGKPGDFAGTSGDEVPVEEYIGEKQQ